MPEPAVKDENQEQLEREQQHAVNTVLAEAEAADGWVRVLAGRRTGLSPSG